MYAQSHMIHVSGFCYFIYFLLFGIDMALKMPFPTLFFKTNSKLLIIFILGPLGVITNGWAYQHTNDLCNMGNDKDHLTAAP